jgi:osmoprotectant transport system permease protein
MSLLSRVVNWFADGAHWRGDAGVPHRMFEHVEISVLAVLAALLVALPVGLLIGHKRRGEFIAVSVGNIGRALPSFGILALIFPFTLRYFRHSSIGFPPTLIALILLAIPPVLTNTYVGVRGVDRDTLEAARGMGLTGWQMLSQLEFPLAVPLIVAGVRTAAVQVVATATLGAVFSWGGLGRFIVDGFAVNDNVQILAGAILVAFLAILTEVTLALVGRLVRPRTASRSAPAKP